MSTPKRVTELQSKLAEKGIVAVYGGGAKSKGHGFWLYQATPKGARMVLDLGFYCDIPGKTLENDGKKSGNPCFWMYADAKKLAA